MRPRLWNPEMELMSDSDMRALQLVKLKSLLNRVYEQSPYYRDKFDRAGVNPRNLKSLEHYQDYPFFDKDEERASGSPRHDGHLTYHTVIAHQLNPF